MNNSVSRRSQLIHKKQILLSDYLTRSFLSFLKKNFIYYIFVVMTRSEFQLPAGPIERGDSGREYAGD